jgi:hypothetical protein
MLTALPADTARHIRRIRAVLEVLAPGCRQGGIQLLGPFLVSPAESPDLVGRQFQVAERRPERLPRVDRLQELLP